MPKIPFVLRPRVGDMPFLDHLEELRWRVLTCLVAVIIGTGIGFFAVTQFNVLGILIRPIEPLLEGSRLAYLSPTDPFFITLKLAVLAGVLLTLPILIYQVWAFLSPALSKSERRAIIPSLYMGLVLFMSGMAMAYYVVLPMALRFTMGFQQEALQQNIVIGDYLSVVIKLLLAFGVVFELPVVILVLSVLGLVTPKLLRDKRDWAFVSITILASLLTPGDLVSTFLMMVPLFILYEFSIGLSVLVTRRRLAEAAAEA